MPLVIWIPKYIPKLPKTVIMVLLEMEFKASTMATQTKVLRMFPKNANGIRPRSF